MTTFKETLDALSGLTNSILKVQADLEKSGDLQEHLKFFYSVSQGYALIDAARKQLYVIKDRMDKHVIPEKIEAAGFDKVQVPDIGRSFYLTTKYSASIIDKDLGFEWLRANDLGAIITETVNAGTLASTFKSMVEDQNREPPVEIFKFSSYVITGSSKYTPKKPVI